MTMYNSSTQQPVLVPMERLSPEALSGLIEEFVTRSGTDYGQREVSLAEKCAAIRKQLTNGRAVILCDPASQTCNIVLSEDAQRPGTNGRKKGTP